MTGVEPWNSGIESDCSTNRATPLSSNTIVSMATIAVDIGYRLVDK